MADVGFAVLLSATATASHLIIHTPLLEDRRLFLLFNCAVTNFNTGVITTMRKRIRFRQLGRTSSHKWAMLRNLVTSLIEHERVVTTVAKAKEVQGVAEKLITMAKHRDSLHGRRQANRIVRTSEAQTKLMTVLGPRYAHRTGGYTRVLKLAQPRKGDNADMAVIEYVDRPGEIRAARPPSAFAGMTPQQIMDDLLSHDTNNNNSKASNAEKQSSSSTAMDIDP
jgi:large subunit ribosomal protein L17